jgi:hypothetical protein
MNEMNFQTDNFVHSIDIGINSLYFSEQIHPQSYGYSFFSKRSKVKNKHVIYEGNDIPSDADGELILSSKTNTFTKASEILYILPEIFNQTSYKNPKKFKNVILDSEKLAKKLNLTIRLATIEDFSSIDTLHTTWVGKKMSDPRVHKHSFSTNRYIKCVRIALEKPSFLVYVAERDNEIIGVRVISVNNMGVLFGAAFFVKFWERSQLSEAINIKILRELHDKGYQYFNTGLASGSLKKYKQQIPHVEVFVYRKNQVNERASLNELL